MPRLSKAHYRWRHNFLTVVVTQESKLLTALPTEASATVLRYYAVGQDLGAQQLETYRTAIDAAEPSLGARAGKQFKLLIRTFDRIVEIYGEQAVNDGWAITDYMRRDEPERQQPFKPKRPQMRQLAVRAVPRPEPDLQKLAMALLALATQQANHEQRNQDESDAA